MPAPPLLWADDDDGDKPPIDSSQAPDLADSAEHMPTRPAKSADAPPLPSSSKTASLYNSGPVSLFDASSSSSDELPSNSDSEALDHSDGSSIDSQDAKTSTRATAFSQQQISLGIAANSISNSRSSLDPVVLAQELETERARSQELEKMLALADKQIVSLQKALAAAELQVGVVKGRATSSASALDGPATDGLADGLQNGVSTEASTWDQLAAEEPECARKARLAKLQRRQQQQRQRGPTASKKATNASAQRRRSPPRPGTATAPGGAGGALGQSTPPVVGSAPSGGATADAPAEGSEATATPSVSPPTAPGASTRGNDSWDDDDSDECSSLSSFDEEDSEGLVQATPSTAMPTPPQANQEAQPATPPVDAAGVPPLSTAAAAVGTDSEAGAEDQEADRLVLEWSAGKSIVEMLSTLHHLWPSAQPRELTDAQGNSLSLLMNSSEAKAAVRREYLRSVRKVHPDKVGSLPPPSMGDGSCDALAQATAQRRRVFLAQKLFAALTDAYRAWMDNV